MEGILNEKMKLLCIKLPESFSDHIEKVCKELNITKKELFVRGASLELEKHNKPYNNTTIKYRRQLNGKKNIQ